MTSRVCPSRKRILGKKSAAVILRVADAKDLVLP